MSFVLLNLGEARKAERARALARNDGEVRLTRAAISPQLFDLGAAADERGFRRITSPATLRDLNPLMQERMQQVCFFLAVTTPFGKRIVEIITSYVIGEGFQLAAEDPAAQEVLDRFAKDPINNLRGNLREWCRELAIFGELCLPTAVNPVDGFVRLGYVDPQEIDAIAFGGLQTARAQELSIPVAVRLRQRIGESEGRRLAIVRAQEDSLSEDYGRLSGECFYLAINKAKSASRGISELFSLADWIDVFDQMVFDFADKVRFLNTFVWEFVLKGADQAAVEAFKKAMLKNPPRQGGFQVHNESVEMKPQTPDLKSADMHEAARMVKLYGLGGAGLPAWFFADPMDANRSTAIEMEGPTGKKLTDWQNVLRELVHQIGAYALDQAVGHGVLPEGGDLNFKVIAPDMSIRDMTKAASVLQVGGNALALAEDRGWIRKETAARAFHTALGQLGVEVESKKEFEEAQQEREDRMAQDVNQFAPQKNLADALKQLPPAKETVQ